MQQGLPSTDCTNWAWLMEHTGRRWGVRRGRPGYLFPGPTCFQIARVWLLYHQRPQLLSNAFSIQPLCLDSSNQLYFRPRSGKAEQASLYSVQFSSVAQSCLTLCDPMNCSMPGLPVHHQLPEFTKTRVHRVSDAIQPSHPLSSPSPPAANPSQDQGLFQWVNSSHEVAKVLEFQL